MRLLIPFYNYRLDGVAFVAAVIFGLLLCRSAIEHRRPGYKLPSPTLVVTLLAILFGLGLAEWAGYMRRSALTERISGLGPTYALELKKLGHAKITAETRPDDPTYLALIDAQKNWLRVNPSIADIYTFRAHDERRVALLVDSETDYNRDGVYDGEREQRTAIGEVYEETTDNFLAATRGEAAIDTNFQADRWGVWTSSLTPIYDEQGRVEAAVGIDYPAADWITAIMTSRALALACMLVIVAIFFAHTILLSVIRAENDQRKQAEVRLHEAVHAAQTANQAKGEFLAVMSHEIRTPLTAVLGFASVLSETKLDATQRRYVETIISAGDRLVAMLNDVLDLSKIEEGKLVLDHYAYSPTLLINEVIDLMTPSSTEKGLRLLCENKLGDSLAIEGDPARLRQILINLLNNAIKFTDRGDVTLCSRWIPPAEPGGRGELIFDVIDTGIGISSEKLPALFQQFSQLHGASRRYAGAGLGLAICKRLVDLMGGRITVESVFGFGSHFLVQIPCAAAQPLPGATVKSGDNQARSSNSTPPMRGRALVVDDQIVNRELLKVMLRRQGYLADLAATGGEAVTLCATNEYAVVFMDLEMPDLDGYATTAKIRAQEQAGRRTPIVAVTAATVKGTRERCLAVGMDDYLTKPVYLPALKSSLQAMVSTEGTPVQPPGPSN
jgi:signal transduction histidine kinase/CheY-like chemotaxis protein